MDPCNELQAECEGEIHHGRAKWAKASSGQSLKCDRQWRGWGWQSADDPGAQSPAQPRRRDPDGVALFALSPEVMVCGVRGESHLTFSAHWPSFSPLVAAAQVGPPAALPLPPLRLLVFLEEDKGSDHDVLAAGSVLGRGRVDAGRVERPARHGPVGDQV